MRCAEVVNPVTESDEMKGNIVRAMLPFISGHPTKRANRLLPVRPRSSPGGRDVAGGAVRTDAVVRAGRPGRSLWLSSFVNE